MNKRNWKLFLYLGIALIVGWALGHFFQPAPGGSSGELSTTPPTEISESSTTWTCSMHPQIQQPEPGDCPICGMDLIPLSDEGQNQQEPRTLSLSEAARALAEIETASVIQDYPLAKVNLVGKLDYDETREKRITARFPARIDHLYVNYNGITVQSGEHLAKVYSPELLRAQKELISAYESNPDGNITRSAREKLRLWDLLPSQIEEILESGQAQDQTDLLAPIGGIVIEKNVNEGDYVDTGAVLFRIADLSQLWLRLDAYESDLSKLRFGQEVTFTVEAYPGEVFTGTIAFIKPEVEERTRTTMVRVNVPNREGRLKPGMLARGTVQVKLAAEGKVFAPEFAGKWISPMHPEIVKDEPGNCDICGMKLVPAEELGFARQDQLSPPLLVPDTAVLKTGKRAVVYVEQPDSERPTYQGREVLLGPRAGNFYIVKSGLERGDRVVTHGAFKIDSALQIQAKPSMMNPPEEPPALPPVPEAKVSPDLALAALPHYLKLQEALASDDFGAAQIQVEAILSEWGHEGPLHETLHAIAEASSLEGLRRPHFEVLSRAFIQAVQENPDRFTQSLYRMHCPMVYEDRGADWLQDSQDLRNPYFGASMLGCGEIREQL